jgi:hypothetical protein
MKKTLLIVALVVLALGALGVGAALAQGGQPPYGPGMMQGGYGWMHDYVERALASQLGISEESVEEQLASGKSMYQVALDNGVVEDDMAAFLTEVHTTAFDQAVADGVITSEQAELMLNRMQGMWTNGYGPGNCPMHGYSNGQTGGYGPGGMMGGRGWRNP